jgi:hypothetical protein
MLALSNLGLFVQSRPYRPAMQALMLRLSRLLRDQLFTLIIYDWAK